MDCARFRDWLSSGDPARNRLEAEAAAHAANCRACARLLAVDRAVESTLTAALRRPEVPAGLAERVSLQTRENRPARRRWRWPVFAVPAAAAAALVLILAWPGPRLTGVEQVALLAVRSHTAHMPSQFSGDEVRDVGAWFRGRLAFVVRPPSSGLEGARLTGGRRCALGREKAAYLFYGRGDKRLSLFVLPADAIETPLEEGREYRHPVGGCEVQMWREGDLAYVLVE